MAKRKSKVETKQVEQVEVVDHDEAVAESEAQDAAEGRKPGGSIAPRPRKHDYGLTDDGVLSRTEKDAVGLKTDVLAGYGILDAPKTFAAFKAEGGTRHAVRVLMRRGLIVNTVGDKVFPQAVSEAAPAVETEAVAGEQEAA